MHLFERWQECHGWGMVRTSPLPLSIFWLGLESFSVAASLAVGVRPIGGLETKGAHVLPLGVILAFQTHALIESPTCFRAWFRGGTIGMV